MMFRTVIALFLLLMGIAAAQEAPTAPATDTEAAKSASKNPAAGLPLAQDASDEARVKAAIELGFHGEHQAALQQLQTLVEKHRESPDLWYAIGVNAASMHDYAKAVHAFEQTCLLNPGDSDAAENLERVRQQIVQESLQSGLDDRVILPGDDDTGTSLLTAASPMRLTLIFATSWALIFLALIVERLKKGALHSLAVVVALIAGLTALGSGALLAGRISTSGDNQYAVLQGKAIHVHSGPGDRYPKTVTAVGGVRVHLRGTFEGWQQISLPDGSDGWVKPSEVEPLLVP